MRLSTESVASSFFAVVYILLLIAFTAFVISRVWYGKPTWNKEETVANPRYKTLYLGLYMKYHNNAFGY